MEFEVGDEKGRSNLRACIRNYAYGCVGSILVRIVYDHSLSQDPDAANAYRRACSQQYDCNGEIFLGNALRLGEGYNFSLSIHYLGVDSLSCRDFADTCDVYLSPLAKERGVISLPLADE